jgi:hypothetical protein
VSRSRVARTGVGAGCCQATAFIRARPRLRRSYQRSSRGAADRDTPSALISPRARVRPLSPLTGVAAYSGGRVATTQSGCMHAAFPDDRTVQPLETPRDPRTRTFTTTVIPLRSYPATQLSRYAVIPLRTSSYAHPATHIQLRTSSYAHPLYAVIQLRRVSSYAASNPTTRSSGYESPGYEVVPRSIPARSRSCQHPAQHPILRVPT